MVTIRLQMFAYLLLPKNAFVCIYLKFTYYSFQVCAESYNIAGCLLFRKFGP